MKKRRYVKISSFFIDFLLVYSISTNYCMKLKMKTTILYDENLIIKLPKKMKQDIQEISKNNNQTVSEYVRSLIANEIRKN